MPGIESDHPHLLLWYVSGDLPSEQHRETEAHLTTCSSCQREVNAIRAMLETVRAEDRAARESARFARAGGPGDTGGLVGHAGMSDAAPMRLEANGSAGLAPAVSSRAARGWTLAGFGFAAGLLLGGSIGLSLQGGRPATPSAPLIPVGTVALTPPLRGSGHAPALTPPGPWAATVVLPFGGPHGRCEVSIQREDGSLVQQRASASPDADGTITVLIPPLAGPASLELVVEPSAGEAGQSWRYPFEIAPADAAANPADPPAAP